MAYKSNIALAIKADKIKYFLSQVAFNENCADFFGGKDLTIFTEFKDKNDENGILFNWNEVKWYTSYFHIILIEDFLNQLKASGDSGSYYFLRIGEEPTDVDMHGIGGQTHLKLH